MHDLFIAHVSWVGSVLLICRSCTTSHNGWCDELDNLPVDDLPVDDLFVDDLSVDDLPVDDLSVDDLSVNEIYL